MRLLHVHKLQLEEYFDAIPRYAILSHTWGKEEVTFSDMSSGQAETRKGYAKIKNTCLQTARLGLDYCWIDTCCIDKSSSNELSEAINSMFKWYASSQICFAFLEDVSASSYLEDLPNARWFKRGWTLQELLAPTRVVFLDRNWDFLGDSLALHPSTDEDALPFMESISSITCIPVEILRTHMSFRHKSIAKRMSWAWNRTTTRVEDIAYCLLGIFQVNMALLYGEGERAFFRLQEEIIKSSNDQSILVWETSEESYRVNCLASSPKMFKDSGMVVPFGDNHLTSPPYAITNRGLQIQLPVMQADYYPNRSVAFLDCHLEDEFSLRFAIELRGDSKTSIHAVMAPPFRIPYKDTSRPKLRTLYLPTGAKEFVQRMGLNSCDLRCWARFSCKHPCDYVLEDIVCEKSKTMSLNGRTNTAHLTWNTVDQQEYTDTIGLLISDANGVDRFVVVIECSLLGGTFFASDGAFELKGLDILQYTSKRAFREWYEENITTANYKCINRFKDENKRGSEGLPDRGMEHHTLRAIRKIESYSPGQEIESRLVAVEADRQLRFGHQLCVLNISVEPLATDIFLGNEPFVDDDDDENDDDDEDEEVGSE